MANHEAIMQTLVPRPKSAIGPSWTLIGREFYCQRSTVASDNTGVFKLEIWNGGTYDAFVGLVGTYVSHAAGKVDTIEFRFCDLLVPDFHGCDHPNARNTDHVSIYTRAREPWKWYCDLRPVSLKPLHDAISAWMRVWRGQ
jgi:hypothetical protein